MYSSEQKRPDAETIQRSSASGFLLQNYAFCIHHSAFFVFRQSAGIQKDHPGGGVVFSSDRGEGSRDQQEEAITVRYCPA
jgi:hypothetical protein